MLEVTWFWLLAGMLATYVTLGGADLGAGILHMVVARDDAERRQVLRTLAPVWKPNEVWLVAAAGTLLFAFPVALATSFSGFYLPVMLVLWLIVFRNLGIELRHQLADSMWSSFWDASLCFASLLLTACLGAALGNVVRGVSLDGSGSFFTPLWTSFLVGDDVGVIDWYTALVGALAVLALAHHGALRLAAYTDGRVHGRATAWAGRLWGPLALASLLVTGLSFVVQPAIRENIAARPWGLVFPVAAAAGMGMARVLRTRGRAAAAFCASSVTIYALLATAAMAVFPNLLPARDPRYSLSLFDAASSPGSLRVALAWWIPGMLLVFGYMRFVRGRMPRTVSIDE